LSIREARLKNTNYFVHYTNICQSNGWKYIITLQDGSLPALQGCSKDDPPTRHNSFVNRPECTVKNTTATQQFYRGRRFAAQKT